MNEITLTLTVDETNVVLQALGQLPYVQSADLINKVAGQANAQVSPPPAPPEVEQSEE